MQDRTVVIPADLADVGFWTKAADTLGDFAINLVIALIVLVLAVWASRLARGLVRRALGRWPRTRDDATLQGFAGEIVRVLVIAIGLIAVLQRLGVQTASIIAVLGAASLAIGLALQGALSNVAAGVMLLVLRPYRVGDFIEAAGKMGTVRSLDLFHTELADPDGVRVVLPNAKAFGDIIVNHSVNSPRRMELHFAVPYENDAGRAVEILLECARADPRILSDPAPWANVTALTDNGQTATLRAWAPLEVYWDARFDTLRRVREALKAEGFGVAYPHAIAVPYGHEEPPPPS